MAGFAAIIAAIRQRGVSDWPPRQRVLLQSLFGASAAAITFALMPGLLVEAGISETFVWRFGSAALVAMLLTISVYRRVQSKKLNVPFNVPKSMMIWVLLVALIQGLNVAHLALSWPYLLGVFSLLVNGFAIFMMLLLGPTDEPGNVA